MATLSKLVRLSYRQRIQSVIPPAFAALLAADNDVLPLPGPPEATADDTKDGAANGAHEDERDAETVRAYQLLQMVRPADSRLCILGYLLAMCLYDGLFRIHCPWLFRILSERQERFWR